MKKQEWTVRVVNWTAENRTLGAMRNHLLGVWVEQLRYMGMARELASYEDRSVVEFYCPNSRGIDTKVWAEQNAARMRSFGIDAAAAPKWTGAEAMLPQPQPAGNKWREQHMERFNRPRT